MNLYPRAITELFKIEVPIIQAPMLGVVTAEMIIGVAEAGGLGSLPASHLSAEEARCIFSEMRRRTSKPINVNFLCHESPERNPACEDAWVQRLTPYYAELSLASDPSAPSVLVPAFGSAHCELLEEITPEVVSFTLAFRRDIFSIVCARPARRSCRRRPPSKRRCGSSKPVATPSLLRD